MDKVILLEQIRDLKTEGKDVKTLYNEISGLCMKNISGWQKPAGAVRKAYYLSIEFLMGRMFHNNLLELGIINEVEEILRGKGISLNDFEEVEDAALGNGGLGRLAACFLDSAAARGVPLEGYGIRYRYGLFRQKFEDGCQRELPDDWLSWGDPWSVRRESESRVINFADMQVIAVPYDMPVIGKTINTLRLYQAEGSKEAEKISSSLYPADDTEEGKLLRIRQEYFLSAAAVGDVVDKFVAAGGTNFRRFPRLNAIQLNDTHPVLAIAELIRLLTTEHGLTFAAAFSIAQKTFNYTNHTILPEALECWDCALMEKILPDIVKILKCIQVYAERQWLALNCTKEEIAEMSILRGGRFSMANTAVYVSEHVNGVAEIHSGLVKTKLFPAAYKYYPSKFLNVTNGVAQRRWLMLCNRELSAMLDKYLTPSWRSNFRLLEGLDTTAAVDDFIEVKAQKKKQLADYVLSREGIKINEHAVIFAQVKRLHEYKRQLMTAFALLDIYYGLKDGKYKNFQPSVFVFGAKAASGYRRAKGIIKFINEIAKLVNGDSQTRGKLQIVFVQNYNVSYAEKIIAGSDVSLQVSTAGFEASGTGNMKFMINGAVTVGTLDGANIEIVERAGAENNYVFGATVDEIENLTDGYDPNEIMKKDERVSRVVNTLVDGTFSDGGTGIFKELHDALLKGASWHKPDHYFVLHDLNSYVAALVKASGDYADRKAFAKKQLENVAHSSFFSSDRSIADYASKVWKI